MWFDWKKLLLKYEHKIKNQMQIFKTEPSSFLRSLSEQFKSIFVLVTAHR